MRTVGGIRQVCGAYDIRGYKDSACSAKAISECPIVMQGNSSLSGPRICPATGQFDDLEPILAELLDDVAHTLEGDRFCYV